MSLLSRLLGRKATQDVAWMETDELSKLLAGPSPPLVVDVRAPEEFTGPLGHIETALNIPLGRIPEDADALLSERRPLVLVCHTDRRSAAAAELLRAAGGTDIAVLRGGMVAWQSSPTP
jgi:rhodanese-related sulfurtransferase